ncbi:Cro/CI family transcriptional regulator [Pseudomonas sp. M47T1]|uniref:helix-turn-helix domain-containing protein n=1 Tax=unclassified Pseudomonas TaxID=196821 RepID=UPI0002606ED1|nr:helix-turn-helix transcriptional regulator [Pseudomonas sp. M47T1]EIK97969.1 Cro/CI family transcriptional regulator [Pseudomonas sp. M47T1]
MGVQVISRDGKPEYAVLPWDQYQALLAAAGQPAEPPPAVSGAAPQPASEALPALTRLGPLREAKGLALDKLARTVGISPSYLAMIESGEREPDAAIRRSLAWELGVPGWGDPS